MATLWEDVDVGCPYYLGARKRTIRCEGARPCSEVAVVFAAARAQRETMERYCARDWGKCPYFRAADEKYAQNLRI